MRFRIGFIGIVGMLLFSFNGNVFGQNYNSQKRITVYATKFPEAGKALNTFISRNAVRLQRKEEMSERFVAEFILPERYLPALDSIAHEIGWVHENTLTTQDFQQRISQIQQNIQDEEARQARIREQLKEPGLEAGVKQNLMSQLENSQGNVRRSQQEIKGYQDNLGLAFTVVSVYDEVTFPTGNSKISLVNMPGVEFSLLFPENPKAGLSADCYQGYRIKYLFTRGKSYLNLGVYKASPNVVSDSSLISELFLINFGQDFYPKHFGRGRRKYLNLYTTYQVGGFIVHRNDDRNNTFNANLNLGLGLELIKTRHILVDNKVSYFLPLNKLNRNLRSIGYNLSFNFVF